MGTLTVAPFAGTKVIHPGWSRHHQPTATGGMNAACVITDPARSIPGGWDDDTGEYGPSTPFVVVAAPDGKPGWPCRVQRLLGDQDSEQAGQDSTTRRYLAQLHDPHLESLPDVEVGHVLTVTAAANDPHLVGLALRVVDVQHGSERFTRDLTLEHNQQTQTT